MADTVWIAIDNQETLLNSAHIVRIDKDRTPPEEDDGWNYTATMSDGSTYGLYEMDRPKPGHVVPNANPRLVLLTAYPENGQFEYIACPIVAWAFANNGYAWGALPIGIDGGIVSNTPGVHHAVLDHDTGKCVVESEDEPLNSIAEWLQWLSDAEEALREYRATAAKSEDPPP